MATITLILMQKLRHEQIARPSPSEVQKLPRHPITVVLDNVRSLYNVGAVFRTSDAALVERVILTGITATPSNRGMHKTALGAQDTVPWDYAQDGVTAIRSLIGCGYTVAALELTDTPTATTALPRTAFPLCLIVGNELGGVSEDLLVLAEYALEIPQYGAKQSLNVAVAYGIAIYDIVRIWRSLA